jgi:hypothetical protein
MNLIVSSSASGEGLPPVTLLAVHQALVDWLDTARSRLAIAVELRARAGGHIELSFVGINPAIGALLTSRELSVFVEWEERNWDLFLSLDVMPRRTASGYICEHCKPEQRTIFPDLEALWRDHLFEPFLQWVNANLVAADAVGLYGSSSSGWTSAELLAHDDARRTEPDIRILLRASQHQ